MRPLLKVSRSVLLVVVLTGLCASALAGTPAVTMTPVGGSGAPAVTGLRTVVLAVDNMTCPICPITVRKALEQVPGVSKASADLESATATVSFDPAKTGIAALIKATTDAGYPSHLRR